MKPRKIYSKGTKFGRWTILNEVPTQWNEKRRFTVRCDCGKESSVQLGALLNGMSTHCLGCNTRKHGDSGSRLYSTWKRFCQKKMLCSLWAKNFSSFKKYAMNHHYRDDLFFTRKDKTKKMSPNNCLIGVSNQKFIHIKREGISYSLHGYLKVIGKIEHYGIIRYRITNGTSVLSAINQPIRQWSRQ